ncbi:MAG: beta-galactosidase small subunit, partial [Planctomycetota bacterium]
EMEDAILVHGELHNELVCMPYTIRYRSLGHAVSCEYGVSIPTSIDDVPRIGLSASLPPGFEQVCWYGRGPHECYPDRRSAAFIGRYASTVDDLQVPYILPQENGHRCDSRWLSISDGKQQLLVIGHPHFGFNCTHHDIAQLATVHHQYELQRQDATHLFLDAQHRGLGHRSCGQDTLQRYRIGPGEYRLHLLLLPMDAAADPGQIASSLRR